MAEPDESPELQEQIDAARQAGDPVLADELYQKQIGNTDPYGDKAAAAGAVAVLSDARGEGEAEAPSPSPSDIQGMGGSGMADYVPYDKLSEDEKDKAFEDVFLLADPDTSKGVLQREWPGAEFDRNVAFGEAFLTAIPGTAKALRVLETVGVADHPDLVRVIVAAGRLMAATAGDPTTIPTTTEKGKQMSTIKDIEAEIRSLQGAIDKAQAQHDGPEANRLYQEQLALGRRLPGGADPASDGTTS